MLDPIIENVSEFEDLSYLDVSPHEHFNATIKKFIRMTSMRKTFTANEAIIAMNAVPFL